MATLVLFNGATQKKIELGANNTIGRGAASTIQLVDEDVSKLHAEIILREDGKWVLRDRGSTNGTFVGEVRVAEHILGEGDEITVGSTSLQFINQPRLPGVTVVSQLRDATIQVQRSVSSATDFLPGHDINDLAVLRHDYEKLRFAHRLNQTLSLEGDEADLLGRILDEVFEFLPAERAVILLSDDKGEKMVPRCTRRAGTSGPDDTIVLSKSILDAVRQTKCGLLMADAALDSRFGGAASVIQQKIRSVLCVPLLDRDRLIGAIHLDTLEATGAFSEKDLQILEALSGQVARAVVLIRERHQRATSERLALVGRMLASVAHDLRTPMTVVQGFAELMALNQENQYNTQQIMRQIENMNDMVADLLAFARGDRTLRPSRVRLDGLAKELEVWIRPTCEQIGLQFRLTVSPDAVWIDSGRVRRIVQNLATNAIQALGSSGMLELDMQKTPTGIAIRVSDNGPGLPAEIRDRLFEPFVTTHRSEGSGLGLSIVKHFVEAHKGEISVDSTPGRGTTFRVLLPEAPAPTRAASS